MSIIPICGVCTQMGARMIKLTITTVCIGYDYVLDDVHINTMSCKMLSLHEFPRESVQEKRRVVAGMQH